MSGRIVKSMLGVCGRGPMLACLLATGCSDPPAATPPAVVMSIPDPFPVEVTGSNFEWRLRYPGPDGELGTADDRAGLRHPHVPEHVRVQFQLKSNDYLYSFALPERKVKEIAVPDLSFQLHLQTGPPTELELKGDQFCGFAHPHLSGRVVVESRQQFAAWVDSLPLHQ